MKIEFADPGYDWTALTWTGGILVVMLLVVLIGSLSIKYGNPREWDGFFEHWPAIVALFTFVWLILGFGMGGGITGAYVYADRVQDAQMTELLDLGFTSVDFLDDEDDDAPDLTFVAERNGAYFKGTLVRDPLRVDYVYSVMEWKSVE